MSGMKQDHIVRHSRMLSMHSGRCSPTPEDSRLLLLKCNLCSNCHYCISSDLLNIKQRYVPVVSSFRNGPIWHRHSRSAGSPTCRPSVLRLDIDSNGRLGIILPYTLVFSSLPSSVVGTCDWNPSYAKSLSPFLLRDNSRKDGGDGFGTGVEPIRMWVSADDFLLHYFHDLTINRGLDELPNATKGIMDNWVTRLQAVAIVVCLTICGTHHQALTVETHPNTDSFTCPSRGRSNKWIACLQHSHAFHCRYGSSVLPLRRTYSEPWGHGLGCVAPHCRHWTTNDFEKDVHVLRTQISSNRFQLLSYRQ